MADLFPARSSRARLAPRIDPFTLCLLVLGFSLAIPDHAGATTMRLALGGGMRAPLTSEQRDNYDRETTFSFSVAGPISTGDVWVYAEWGYGYAKGDPYEDDPTFHSTRVRYSWAPLSIGFRTNAVPVERRRDLALYLGVGGIISTVTMDPPFASKESSTTAGVAFEFRPELNLKSGWGFWARDRIALLTGNDFKTSNAPSVNLTGNAVELGISRRIGKEEGATR